MDKAIVITTIYPPTPSVHRWAHLDGWQTVVAADRKTPPDWRCPPARCLTVAQQESAPFSLARKLPWNHYCRKLLGYLTAIGEGADLILDTDDDNMPKGEWHLPDFTGTYRTTAPDMGFVNIYSYFTDQRIWPRGFPLNRVCDPSAHLDAGRMRARDARIGIWQGLADGDPDVDAVYRMTVGASCIFEDRPPVVLGPGTVSPFNSQNTAFVRPVFALLYLPASVSFRTTDIIRGLVAKPILDCAGYRLGFTSATVFQERNAHRLMSDFESEIPCYLNAEKITDAVGAAVTGRFSVEANLTAAYEALVRHHLVPAAEMDLLIAWLRDLEMLKTGGAP